MAIAIDATSKGAITNTTTLTWSHTCSGSDRILVVGGFNFNSGKNFSSVTYNGAAMTLAKSQTFFGIIRLYYLLAPDTGTHDVSITMSGAGDIGGNASSYTGVQGIGATAGNGEQDDSNNSMTTSITLQAANSYTVEMQNSGDGTTGTAINEDSSQTQFQLDFVDGTGIIAGAYKSHVSSGATNLTFSLNSTATTEAQRVAIVELLAGSQPVVGGRPFTNLTLLNVG